MTTEWTEDRVTSVIRALAESDELPEHLKTAPITGTDTVETLGLDSLGAVYLVDKLESELGSPLPDDFLEMEDSVSEIAKRLNQLIAEGQ